MTTTQPPAPTQVREILQQAVGLISRSGFPLSPTEWAELKVNDFGLGNLPAEGFVFADLLRTDRVRVTLLVLLPHQTLPEHRHPPYGDEPGKEETLRCLWGQARVCVPDEPNNPGLRIPAGKSAFYSARHEVVLSVGDQFTVKSNLPHWFQGGPEGAVCLAFQNRVDENRNVFTDPASTGCPIPSTSY